MPCSQVEPNDLAQLPGRQANLHTSKDRNAGPVNCSVLFGGAIHADQLAMNIHTSLQRIMQCQVKESSSHGILECLVDLFQANPELLGKGFHSIASFRLAVVLDGADERRNDCVAPIPLSV